MNPVFNGICTEIEFYLPNNYWDGTLLRKECAKTRAQVFIAPLPEKKKIGLYGSAQVGLSKQILTVLQPTSYPDEELPLETEFEYKNKKWVIQQSQDWMSEGGYFRYYAFLLDDSIDQEEL